MDGRCTARSRVWSACVGTALFAASGAAAAPDVELGRYLAAECVTCHGAASVAHASTSTIPNIYGLPEQTLVEAVKAYRDKKLANAVMQSIAGRLKDEEIEALAAYFARTRRPQ
jgi:cytochrome c553